MKRIGKVMILVFLAVCVVAWSSPSTAKPGHRAHGYGKHSRYGYRSHKFYGYRGGHRFRHRSRFFVGGSIVFGPWYPYYYWPPYPSYYGPRYPYSYYPAPPVVIQQQPSVNVEPESQPSDYWYYCEDAQAYYPYVKECSDGWMKVVPETPPLR